MNFVNLRDTNEYQQYKKELGLEFRFLSEQQNREVRAALVEKHVALTGCFLGGIGHTGKKLHKLTVTYIVLHWGLKNEEVGVALGAYSTCGSQKWNTYSRSVLRASELLTDENRHEINCERCVK